MRLRLSILLMLVASASAFGWWRWDRWAGLRGDLAARYDIAHGRINLLWSGLEDREGPEVRRILWEVYGVQAIPAVGCLISKPQLNYVESYNHRMMAYAGERFGQHFYEAVWEEARWNVAEAPRLAVEQRSVQSARYDLALPRPSERDLPLWFPRTAMSP